MLELAVHKATTWL